MSTYQKNPWIEINRQSIREMLRESRKQGAVQFEAYTDSGEYLVLDNDDRVVEELTSVDLSALVCVNPDGTRWGHFQLVIGQSDMVYDWSYNDATEAMCEAVVQASEKVEGRFSR